ncbi:phenylalanine--tRNA ligase subunit beta [Thermoanaerobacterium sp. DL9XJH110]|uniref:phenylalanine--tRNA ligase subunit beta n=1 Tax=Thermoanaerobacterium sp. DL9XJH110 TaxID=3386643 RepID=UPI003BB7DB23
MLVPISWLKEYVDVNIGIEELTAKLTMSGSNVEGVEILGRDIDKVVIGEIKKVEKHPNADKLLVTQVSTGTQVLQIVTGATNIKENDKVPVALPGSTIHGGQKIHSAKFRGVESEGMLCSARELGLDDHGLPEDMRDGILILPENAPVGADIKDYLSLEDTVIDFEITPNRPDCLSIIGMAREAAATLKSDLHLPRISITEEAEERIDEMAGITIEAEDLCSRYVARMAKDVKIGPSPLWMQRRLQACGVRPINNIVDITNYVMMELGQPLHAFDYEKLDGRSLIVRRGKSHEKIITLDGVERAVSEEMLVIADKSKPVAIAGVMGGADAEISHSTKWILLESANFSGPSIRKTSRKLGLRSEASMRFEKGIDPNLCHIAADRACQLIEELGVGKVLKGSIDVYPRKVNSRRIPLRPEKVNQVLGTRLSTDEMVDILNRLELRVEETPAGIFVNIPTFRTDISKEADLIEEIARIYGYDRLPSTLPRGDATQGGLNTRQKIMEDIKQVLMGCGFSEIYTYSFVSPKVFDSINAPKDSPLRRAIALLNPLGEDQSIMRTTMIPNILDVIKYNLNQKVEEIRLFEAGTVYLPEELPLKELPYEKKRLTLGICGKSMDYYDLKRVIETIFCKLRIQKYLFMPEKHFAFHPGRCAKIMLETGELGIVGEIHPDVLENYDIKKRTYVAEIDLDLLLENACTTIRFKPLPKFPASDRDLAIVVEDRVLAGDIIEAIKEAGGELLEKVELFDVYKGGQIPRGFKSMAFSLTYRAAERTLTDTEVNDVHARIKAHLVEKFNGTLRE